MTGTDRFTVTEEHLKLARRTNLVDWDIRGFMQDPKRPYGNSDVVGDIVEIVGMLSEEQRRPIEAGAVLAEDLLTEEQLDHVRHLHASMATVFEIAAQTGTFAVGSYRREPYGLTPWAKV